MCSWSWLEWQHPEHTIRLCSHVAQCGPDKWQELARQINCAPTHCALRWHVLQLGRLGPAAKTTKAYSEWELCALFLACQQPKGGAQSSKKAIFAELSQWLPGRSLDGLRQAYTHNIQGQEAKFQALLTSNGWPSDLTALLAAWPGPSAHTQAVLGAEGVEGHKAAAEQFKADLAAWMPTVKKQRLPSGAAAQSGFAAAAAAAGMGPDTALRRHTAVRRVFSTVCLGTNTASPSSAAFGQPVGQQQQQLLLPRAHSQPMLLDQHQQQQLAGAQLPVLGLDAFAVTSAAMPASGRTRVLQHSAVHAISSADPMGVLSAWDADLPAQIAADLAGSPCATASSTPSSVMAGVGAAVPGAQDLGVRDSLGSHDELLHLLEGGEPVLELLNGNSAAVQGLPSAAAGGSTAFAATQQGPQAWPGETAVPYSMAPAAAAPAPVAAGGGFAPGPAVILQAPALPMPALAGLQQQEAYSSLPAVLAHVQRVEEQQQQMWAVLTTMLQELGQRLARLDKEGCQGSFGSGCEGADV